MTLSQVQPQGRCEHPNWSPALSRHWGILHLHLYSVVLMTPVNKTEAVFEMRHLGQLRVWKTAFRLMHKLDSSVPGLNEWLDKGMWCWEIVPRGIPGSRLQI